MSKIKQSELVYVSPPNWKLDSPQSSSPSGKSRGESSWSARLSLLLSGSAVVESVGGDIYKFIERRNVYVLAGEVRDDLECSNRAVKDWAVKFGDNVCTTLVLWYDNEWAKISCMHFPIERLFNGGISDQDEVTEVEAILDYGGSMLLFETDHSCDPCSIYVRGEHCQVWSIFSRVTAHWAMRAVEDRGALGRRRRYVALAISRGRKGCIPVVVKYGEQPIHQWTVTRLAHMMEVTTECHFDWSPLHALNSTCRTSKCAHSAMPLAQELCPDIQMCQTW